MVLFFTSVVASLTALYWEASLWQHHGGQCRFQQRAEASVEGWCVLRSELPLHDVAGFRALVALPSGLPSAGVG